MSRDLPSDSGRFGQGQGCLPGRGAKVGRENGTQNRMALLRVGEAGLWDTGPAVHHRGGANGTRARELQENRRWTMAVPGSSRRFPGSLGKPALSPLSRRARGLRGPAPLAFASGVWLHFNFPRVTCAMLPSLPRALWPPSPGPLVTVGGARPWLIAGGLWEALWSLKNWRGGRTVLLVLPSSHPDALCGVGVLL